MIQETEIQRCLDIEQDKKGNDLAVYKARQFYKENQIVCGMSLQYYNDFKKQQDKYLSDISFVKLEQAKHQFPVEIILLLTANSIEAGVLLRYFSEKYNVKWQTYLISEKAYRILQIDGKTIVHTHADRTGDEFTRRAINHAAKIFSIRTLLLLGICYGINPNEQHIGDVIVSNQISGYRINFRDNDKDEVNFEPEIEFDETPDELLNSRVNTFMNHYQPTNTFLASWNSTPQISWKPGKLLSANSLMSSKAVKNSVIKHIGNVRPKAYGGEMEACGIFKSYIFEECKFRNWLVIKSICDWGEKKNSLFPDDAEKEESVKDGFQALAMLNTCSAFETLLLRKVFDERGNDYE